MRMWFDIDEHVLAPGDTTSVTLMAELLSPSATVLAVVSDMGFDLTFGGSSGLIISNNEFNPAFDSDFFGPAADGVVSGDSIIGAQGSNTLPPLNNAGGPDSSNPLVVYSFDVTAPDDPNVGVFLAQLTLTGQITGAYTGSPFPNILIYQDAMGNPGDTPWSVVGFPSITVVPAPASGLALIGLGALTSRRRR